MTLYKERRRYKRREIGRPMLFSDRRSRIGIARVLDACQGGVRCQSFSLIANPVVWVDQVELYDSTGEILIDNLRARMVHCSLNRECLCNHSIPRCYIFGVEFWPHDGEALKRLSQLFER